jgi:hypothetical protein
LTGSKHDVVDWVGGYPYEYASVRDITEFYRRDGLALMLPSNAIYGRHAGAPVPVAIDSRANPVDSDHHPSIFIIRLMTPHIVSVVQKSTQMSFAIKLRRYANHGVSARLGRDTAGRCPRMRCASKA